MAATAKRSVNIYVNGTEAEKTLQELRTEIKKQENEWAKLKKGTMEYIQKAEEIKRLKTLMEEHNRELESTDAKLKRIRENMMKMGAGLGGFTQVLTTRKNGMNYLRDIATDLAKLDDKMHLVRKTTGLTIRQIQELNKEFMTINTRTSREELNELAYAAGKLGINTKEGVLQFVKAADEINVALGDVLGGTQSIIEITKMMEVFRQSTEEIAGEDMQRNLIKTGSVINELGKQSTANEKNITAFLGRISGVSAQLGISLDQAAGYASVFDQTKQHVEMSATALQRMFTEMIKKPAEYARAAGMELEKFKELMQKDFNEATIKVLEGFGRAGGMEPLVKAFKDMGLDGQRAVAAITQLASHTDMLRTAQQQANTAMKEGTSTGKEYATMNESLQAKMEIARKAVQDARIELGEKMYPAVLKVLSIRGTVIKWLSETVQKSHRLLAVAASTALVLGSTLVPRLNELWKKLKETRAAITLKTIATYKDKKANLDNAVAQKQDLLYSAKLDAAKKRLAVTLNATTASNKALAKAEKEVAIAEKALAQAQKARDNIRPLQMLKTNWMLIAQAIIFAAMKLTEFIKKQRDTIRKTREMKGEIVAERQEADRLFSAYRNLNNNAAERAKILKAIQDKYGEYLKNLTDEKGNLLDIANAQRIVNEELERNTRLKFFNNKKEEIQEDHKKKIGRYTDRIQDIGAGKVDMGEVYRWIGDNWELYNRGLFGGKAPSRVEETLAKNARAQLTMILNRAGLDTKGVFGAEEGWTSQYKRTENNIIDLFKETARMNREIQESQKAFGLTEKKETKTYTAEEVFITAKQTNRNILADTEETTDKIGNEWERLMERVSDLNRKYDIKETPMSKAKQQAMQEYKEMADAIKDFTDKNKTYKEKGNKVIAELEKELWKQINRIDAEERDKNLKETEKRLKNVSERMEAFRLKQRRKSQSKLETDLEEISLDFTRLSNKIQEEIKKYEGQREAGTLLEQLLSTSPEDTEKIGELTEKLKEYGVTAEKAAELRDMIKDGKTTDDILTMLGLGLNGDEEQKIKELMKLMEEFTKVGIEEAGTRVRESMEEISRSFLSTGRRIYEEQKRTLELQIREVQAAEKYYETLKKGDKTLQNLRQYREKLTGQTANIGGQELTLSDIAERTNLWVQQQNIKRRQRNADRKSRGMSEGVWELFGISDEDWHDWKNNWLNNLQSVTGTVADWGENIMSIMSYVLEYENNKIEEQTKKIEEEYDTRSKEWRSMLEKNIISQKYYDAQMEKMEKEKEEREKRLKHDNFDRQKKASMAEAIISGQAAAVAAFKNGGGWPWGLIPMALSLAETAIKVAAISSQANPYYKGGYIRGRQYAVMGERGDEWVASNKLLREPGTAEIIEALERYQRGDKKALTNISVTVPDAGKLSHAISAPMPKFAPSNTTTTNNYYNSDNPELLKEIRQMNIYLRDPRNRQAVINRNILLEYEKNEKSLKEIASL